MFKCCMRSICMTFQSLSYCFAALVWESMPDSMCPSIQKSIQPMQQLLETRDSLHNPPKKKGNILFELAVFNVKISSPFNHSHVQLCVIPEAHFDIAWGKWHSRWQEWIKWFHCFCESSCPMDTWNTWNHNANFLNWRHSFKDPQQIDSVFKKTCSVMLPIPQFRRSPEPGKQTHQWQPGDGKGLHLSSGSE